MRVSLAIVAALGGLVLTACQSTGSSGFMPPSTACSASLHSFEWGVGLAARSSHGGGWVIVWGCYQVVYMATPAARVHPCV